MADQKISQLTAGDPALVTDELPVSRTADSVTRKITALSAARLLAGATVVVGDIPYADATTPTWGRIAAVATGAVLVSAGTGTAPAWSAAPVVTTSFGIKVNAAAFFTAQTGTLYRQANLDATENVMALDSAASANRFHGRRSEGTMASPSATGPGSPILSVAAFGWDSTNTWRAATAPDARINFVTAEAYTATAHGTKFNLDTTPIGSITVQTSMTVGPSGVMVGAPTGGDKGTGTINVAGVYYANNTAGVTAGPFTTITGITVKNGIVTALTGS